MTTPPTSPVVLPIEPTPLRMTISIDGSATQEIILYQKEYVSPLRAAAEQLQREVGNLRRENTQILANQSSLDWRVKESLDQRDEAQHRNAALEKRLAECGADAFKAASIGMAFMVSHFGAFESFSSYQRDRFNELSDIHKRNQNAALSAKEQK